MINVRDYGATGNGTTDDTAAINNALQDTSDEEWEVQIPAGVYMIDGLISIAPKSGTSLRLHPGAILKVIPNGSTNTAAVRIKPAVENVTITGGEILGDRATHDYTTTPSTHEWGHGILVEGASRVLIDGVKISGCAGDGVYIKSGTAGGIFRQSSGVTLRGCHIDGSRRSNITIGSATAVTVEACIISNGGSDDGVKAGTLPRAGVLCESNPGEAPAAGIHIHGCTLTGNVNTSINNSNGTDFHITDNNADSRINIGGRSSTTIISGNTLTAAPTAAGQQGIAMDVSKTSINQAQIINNIISGFDIGIIASQRGVVVSNNTIIQYASRGIALRSSTEAIITGNRIQDGVGATCRGIQVTDSDNALISDNQIDTAYQAVAVETLPSTSIVVSGNMVRRSVNGITINHDSQATVTGNDLALAGHPGGQVADIVCLNGTDVVVSDNIIRGSKSYAIRCRMNTATISHNSILGNQGVAINCEGGTQRISSNTIRHGGAGTAPSAVQMHGAIADSIIIGNIATSSGGALTYFYDGAACTGTPATVVAGNFVRAGGVAKPHVSDAVSGNVLI